MGAGWAGVGAPPGPSEPRGVTRLLGVEGITVRRTERRYLSFPTSRPVPGPHTPALGQSRLVPILPPPPSSVPLAPPAPPNPSSSFSLCPPRPAVPSRLPQLCWARGQPEPLQLAEQPAGKAPPASAGLRAGGEAGGGGSLGGSPPPTEGGVSEDQSLRWTGLDQGDQALQGAEWLLPRETHTHPESWCVPSLRFPTETLRSGTPTSYRSPDTG